MIKNIISLLLLIVTAFLSFMHGWSSINFGGDPEQVRMVTELGINPKYMPYIGVFLLVIGVLLLIPKTFIAGNILNSISFLAIMILAVISGHYRIALIEIPFLMMPLILIWLGYPFKNRMKYGEQ